MDEVRQIWIQTPNQIWIQIKKKKNKTEKEKKKSLAAGSAFSTR